MNKKKIRNGIVLFLVAGLIAGGVYRLRRRENASEGVMKLYGNVDIRQSRLAFYDIGRIKRLLVHEGDVVKPGQLLAEIDSVRYEMSVKETEGNVNAQKQVLARMVAGSRPQDIQTARERVKAAEAVLQVAEVTYERIKKLVEGKYVPQQQLDDATAKFKTARADLKAAEEGLTLAVIGPRKEDIAAADARLKGYQATLALAHQKLADTKLYAPSAGVIQNRIMEPGDMASPTTPVFTLALDRPMWVRAYVPEPSLGKIIPGMKAQITTDSFSGKIYKGWIGYISPTAEFTPKNVETPDLRTRLVYQIRVYVCNPNNELRLGMPATVTLRLDPSGPDKNPPGSSVCRDD
jgi:HlyD family secretion protein